MCPTSSHTPLYCDILTADMLNHHQPPIVPAGDTIRTIRPATKTHDRNVKLKGRHVVEKFFKDVREHKSLADHKTRSWLGNLPFYIPEDAIPLLVDGTTMGMT